MPAPLAPNSPAGQSTSLRTCQIIVMALALGASAFFVVAICLAGAPVASAQPIVAYIGLAVAAGAILVRFAMRLIAEQHTVQTVAQLRRQGRSSDFDSAMTSLNPDGTPSEASGSLLGLYQTQLIISIALLEAGAFFNLIAYILQKQAYSVIVAGVLIVYIWLHLPTSFSYINWVRRIIDRASRP